MSKRHQVHQITAGASIKHWVISIRWLFLTLPLLFPAIANPQSELGSERRFLRVGVYENPPKIFADASGRASGILGELLYAIADLEGWQIEPVPCQWNACLDLLESGELDLMPDVAISAERSERFDFHQTSALLSWSQIYEARGVGMLSLLDMDGRRIAVLKGSVQQQYLEQLADSFLLRVDWFLADDLDEGFAAVLDGYADAVAVNHFFGDAQAVVLNLVSTPIMFQPSSLYYAAPAGLNGDLLDTLERYLGLWQAQDGSPYYDILRRWSISEARRAGSVWLLWGLVVLLCALLLTAGFSLLLRRKVDDRTRSLAASEARLNTILNSVDAYIYIKDQDLRYQYANRKVCERFGFPLEQIIGKTDEAFFDAQTSERLRENDYQVIHQGERVANEEEGILTSEHQEHVFLSVKLPLRNPDGTVYALCGISTDITEHKQIRNQLHQLAFFDPLTGLPNRRLVLDRLGHAMAARSRTGFEGALILVDIDQFKIVNDTLGHDVGDLLLKQMARRLECSLFSTDTVGRLGADEFVLIVEDLAPDPDEALIRVRDMTEMLRNRLSQVFDLDGMDYSCTVCMGVAMFSDAKGDVDVLLKAADLALTASKAEGRNLLRFFNPEMQAEVTRRTRIEKALRKAIDEGVLDLYLQPQVDANGTVCGLEALLRWPDPELGMVHPAAFIPVAETTDLIIPLGEWVINRAISMLAQWRNLPSMSDLTLSLNISPRQFHHADFVSTVLDSLRANEVDGRQLELEVTESLLIEDVDTTVTRMRILQDAGVRFSLDDFGTGYASLSYLKRLPLSQLKIDQSFVRDLLNDPNDEAIIKTILALGSSLDLRVIAEGVETRIQAERLSELGCEHFQGYYFGRPAPESVWRETLATSLTRPQTDNVDY